MATPAQHLESLPRPAAADVAVEEVRTRADREAFIQLQYQLYRDDPLWVPPLVMERRDFLDPAKNPFFEFAHVQLFNARRGGRLVGRIAAVDDPRYNEFHGTRDGVFGLFECVDDEGVAAALFDAAARWLKPRGFTRMMGPLSFSTNYECATLVEGFETSPAVLMSYNPRHHVRLYEAAGFQKAKDLLAFELSSSAPPPAKVVRIAEKIRAREGIVIRPVNMKEFAAEVARIKDIYNAAWEKNWGFVPMTDREFEHLARELRPVAVPELIRIAEVKGEPVAFAMTLPDANVALKAAGGRLTRFGLPVGLLKLLWASRRIKRLRLITLGIKQGFRRRGIDAVLYLDTIRIARELGYEGGEISWTLEDNDLINRAIQSMGGQLSKKYRIWQRAL
ncbi:MAG TPA: N-acetyltransferase [Myxococcales bacterium]|jgi:GNAT superfamily N-acetyltransferase|nr:N-acetyltransferase [Myxococcales bacterium]